jgi:hypothetical protein
MSKSTLVIVSLALIGAAWFVGRETAPLPDWQIPRGIAPARVEAIAAMEPGSIVALMTEADAFVRAEKLAEKLRTSGPEALPEVIDFLHAARDPRIGATEYVLIARFWALHDPAAAMSWAIQETPIKYAQTELVIHCAEAWAYVDPPALLEFFLARGVTGPAQSRSYQRAIIRGWYWGGEPGLIEHLRDMGPSTERQRGMDALFDEIIRNQGADVAIAWARSVPEDVDPMYKKSVYRRLATVLGRLQPEAGIAWCDEQCDGPYGSRMLVQFVSGWSVWHARDALEWLATKPASAERDDAVLQAMEVWVRRLPHDAQRWMTAIGPDGVEPWLQPALPEYAAWLSRRHHIEALEWAARIEDESKREQAYIHVVRRWREIDEPAALAWLEAADMSDNSKKLAQETPSGWRPVADIPGLMLPL